MHSPIPPIAKTLYNRTDLPLSVQTNPIFPLLSNSHRENPHGPTHLPISISQQSYKSAQAGRVQESWFAREGYSGDQARYPSLVHTPHESLGQATRSTRRTQHIANAWSHLPGWWAGSGGRFRNLPLLRFDLRFDYGIVSLRSPVLARMFYCSHGLHRHVPSEVNTWLALCDRWARWATRLGHGA